MSGDVAVREPVRGPHDDRPGSGSGSGGGLGRVVRSGVGRRRVQTVVMTLTTLLAVAASVLAAGLVAASSTPFQHAFDRLHGAHLIASFDPIKVTEAEVAATAHAAGVTAVAGPYRTVTLRPRTASVHAPGGGGFSVPAGVDLPPITIAGRPGAGGAVDRLDIIQGRWPNKVGEIVWADGVAPIQVGDQLSFPGAPGSPTLTVVGIARSISQSAQAWVLPEQLTAFSGPAVTSSYQMLYRFQHAATDDDIVGDRAAIAAAVPAGGLEGSSSYLTIQRGADRTAATFAPFVIAFGVLGLVMSVLIIGIVVSGAVSSSTRRIGILKSIGFTPAQVARAYVAQALIPSVLGAALGVLLGNLAAIPVLREEGDAFGTGVSALAPWVSVVVPLGALTLVAIAALVPASRAARLRTVDAIAVGRTPVAGRGRQARAVLGRLALPRAVSLGLGNPFARPARSVTIAVAVMLGALGVTFGIGLASSLAGIQHGLNQRDAGDVLVYTGIPAPGQPGPETLGPVGKTGPADESAVRAAIERQDGTRRYFTSGHAQVGVAGLTDTIDVDTFEGDSSWATYQMIAGRWFSGPGEAVVPTGFLNATGRRIGESITLTGGGHTATVKIVGEVLDLSQDGQVIITDAESLAPLAPGVSPEGSEYHIDVAPGTNIKAYIDQLNKTLQPLNAQAEINTGEISSIVVAMDTLAGFLTLLLVIVAGLGVLNTVVLDTRERVHDLGVFKALGMSPRQTVAMVLTSVGAIGLIAGLIGVPAGILLHNWVLPTMGNAAGTRIPPVDIDVYHLAVLVPLAFGGLLIAITGALLPAAWAARTSTTKALRTE
jgi:putative ABC transport system permease protein